jgi:hypothetical protein
MTRPAHGIRPSKEIGPAKIVSGVLPMRRHRVRVTGSSGRLLLVSQGAELSRTRRCSGSWV